ncbi:MAG: hypothetical protein ACNYZI_11630, partial [Anaerolineales bacterium]
LLLLYGFYLYSRKAFMTTHCEAVLGLFVLLLAGFVTLTIIGIFFRGPGMALMRPWDIVPH